MNDTELTQEEQELVETKTEVASSPGVSGAMRTWKGKALRLEKDEKGMRLCLIPQDAGGEPHCYISEGASPDDADLLALLLTEMGALERDAP